LSAIINITRQLDQQKKFLRRHVNPVLSKAKQPYDGSHDDHDFFKINSYYGLAVPAILGEALAILHQVPFSNRSRECITAQGAMTGLFDDFFDQGMLCNSAFAALMEGTNQP
jgi:hypothetical protein